MGAHGRLGPVAAMCGNGLDHGAMLGGGFVALDFRQRGRPEDRDAEPASRSAGARRSPAALIAVPAATWTLKKIAKARKNGAGGGT